MKNLKICLLLDFYGELLTSKQFEAVDKYYNEDLSLSEIAMEQGISRQGVRDAIKRAEGIMLNMEQKLDLATKFEEIQNGLNNIIVNVDNIEKINNQVNISEDINKNIENIRKTIYEISMHA